MAMAIKKMHQFFSLETDSNTSFWEAITVRLECHATPIAYQGLHELVVFTQASGDSSGMQTYDIVLWNEINYTLRHVAVPRDLSSI